MALPDSFVEEVRRTADIVRYISEHVAAPSLSSHLRRSLQQLKRQVEHEKLRQEGARLRAERDAATA